MQIINRIRFVGEFLTHGVDQLTAVRREHREESDQFTVEPRVSRWIDLSQLHSQRIEFPLELFQIDAARVAIEHGRPTGGWSQVPQCELQQSHRIELHVHRVLAFL